jgi:phage/plasmid primase-like uncharacterized protein
LDSVSVLVEWRKITRDADVARLALALGVTIPSLRALDCVATPYVDTYGFPMRDGKGGIIGIRLRKMNGEKRAVTGSHNGLFIPGLPPAAQCLVCEGPTDTAAALSVGSFAIGRPSCSAGVLQLAEAVRRLRFQRVVIVADCDGPGLRGATTLALHIPVPCCVLALPCKDMRQFVNHGGDKVTLDALVSQLVWRKPQCQAGPHNN